jgi:hypothetical protein
MYTTLGLSKAYKIVFLNPDDSPEISTFLTIVVDKIRSYLITPRGYLGIELNYPVEG